MSITHLQANDVLDSTSARPAAIAGTRTASHAGSRRIAGVYTPSEGPNPYAPPVQQDEWSTAELHQDLWLASRGRRFLGSLIDNLVYLVALAPAVLLIDGDIRSENALLVIGLAVMVIVAVQAVLIATSGQSIAKKLLGMRIVRLDGSPIGFVRGVLVRSWAVGAIASIPTIGGIFGLIDALYIFGAEQRCLHDVMAGSKVVMVEHSVSS
jgi:uncharacterized RDD family membrane protein YckC